MKAVKEKKIRRPRRKPPRPEKAGKARRTWDRGNDHVRDLMHSVAFLTPSVTGVAVFFILPFLVVVYYSVIRSPMNPDFVFLDNFKAVLGNSSFRSALMNLAHSSMLLHPSLSSLGSFGSSMTWNSILSV